VGWRDAPRRATGFLDEIEVFERVVAAEDFDLRVVGVQRAQPVLVDPTLVTFGGYHQLEQLDTLRRFRRHTEGVDLFTLAIQGWAHAQARPKTKAIITESFARQLESYRHAALRWTTRAKAETAVQAIAAAVVGYVVQSAFSDTEIDVARYRNGLTALAGARSSEKAYSS
jgi:hypothetical protein